MKDRTVCRGTPGIGAFHRLRSYRGARGVFTRDLRREVRSCMGGCVSGGLMPRRSLV